MSGGGGLTMLSDLCMWFVGSADFGLRVGSVCDVERLAPEAWRTSLATDPRKLLLVEGAEDRDRRWERELGGLLEACEQAGIPRVLWVTGDSVGPLDLAECRRFDRVFTVERAQLQELESAGARTPTVLPDATALPVDDRPMTDTDERPDSVVWIGGWRSSWPNAWQERLRSIMQAAVPHGLRIVGVAEPDRLPHELRPHVVERDAGPREQMLRRARVVVGADASNGSPRVVPSVVFDAIACGAATVTPHDAIGVTGLWFDPPAARPEAAVMGRGLVHLVRDRESAGAAFERLLGDERERERTVRDSRRIVAYNHTFGNRLASIASAVGHRVLPGDPAHPASD